MYNVLVVRVGELSFKVENLFNFTEYTKSVRVKDIFGEKFAGSR
jgi:hypothetical protein